MLKFWVFFLSDHQLGYCEFSKIGKLWYLSHTWLTMGREVSQCWASFKSSCWQTQLKVTEVHLLAEISRQRKVRLIGISVPCLEAEITLSDLLGIMKNLEGFFFKRLVCLASFHLTLTIPPDHPSPVGFKNSIIFFKKKCKTTIFALLRLSYLILLWWVTFQ